MVVDDDMRNCDGFHFRLFEKPSSSSSDVYEGYAWSTFSILSFETLLFDI